MDGNEMKYVLIAFLWTFEGGAGISQEFDTLSTCQDAASKILQIHEKATGVVSPMNMAICVPK